MTSMLDYELKDRGAIKFNELSQHDYASFFLSRSFLLYGVFLVGFSPLILPQGFFPYLNSNDQWLIVGGFFIGYVFLKYLYQRVFLPAAQNSRTWVWPTLQFALYGILGFLPGYAQFGLGGQTLLIVLVVGLAMATAKVDLQFQLATGAAHLRRQDPDRFVFWENLAIYAAALMVLVTSLGLWSLLSERVFLDWGWRILFGVAGLLIVLGQWISAQSERPSEHPSVYPSPAATLTSWMLSTAWFSMLGLMYVLVQMLAVPKLTVLVLYAMSFAVAALCYAVLFRLASPKTLTRLSLVVSLIAIPCWWFGVDKLLSDANPAAFEAMHRSKIFLVADYKTCKSLDEKILSEEVVSSCDTARRWLAEHRLPFQEVNTQWLGHARVQVEQSSVRSYFAGSYAADEDGARFEWEAVEALSKANWPIEFVKWSNERRSVLVLVLGALLLSILLMAQGQAVSQNHPAETPDAAPARRPRPVAWVTHWEGLGWVAGALASYLLIGETAVSGEVSLLPSRMAIIAFGVFVALFVSRRSKT